MIQSCETLAKLRIHIQVRWPGREGCLYRFGFVPGCTVANAPDQPVSSVKMRFEHAVDTRTECQVGEPNDAANTCCIAGTLLGLCGLTHDKFGLADEAHLPGPVLARFGAALNEHGLFYVVTIAGIGPKVVD